LSIIYNNYSRFIEYHFSTNLLLVAISWLCYPFLISINSSDRCVTLRG